MRHQRTADTGLYHVHQGKNIVEACHDDRPETGFAESVVETLGGGESLVHRHELFMSQIGQIGGFCHLVRHRQRHCQIKGILEQRQGFQPGHLHTFAGQRNQNGIEQAVGKLEQQFAAGIHRQVDFHFRPSALQPHDQARNGTRRQRIQAPQFHASAAVTRGLARRLDRAAQYDQHFIGIMRQRLRGGQRLEIAPVLREKRASQDFFQRMQGTMHADSADTQRFGGACDIAFIHESQKNLQLANRQFGIDHVFC